MQIIQSLNVYGKYRVLIALSGLLLVLNIVLAVLSFYSAGQFAGATQELNLANQQINHIKSISQDVLSLQADYARAVSAQSVQDNNQVPLTYEMQNTIQAIAQKKQDVETWFTILLDGGAVMTGNTVAVLDGTQDATLRAELLAAQDQWKKYDAILTKFVNKSEAGNVLLNPNMMSNKVGSYGSESVAILTQYHKDLGEIIRSRSQLVQYIEVGGILLSLLLFAGVVFGALRRLIRGDALLDSSRQEMREIMKTVNTGLFLLDKNMIIGQQHSEALNRIVGSDKLSGESFISVLRHRISDKDLKTTEEFVAQLYNPKVKEKLVNGLNPLNKVPFHDGSNSRYLDFSFSRVYEQGSIARLLVNVEDVSEEVRLEQRLQKEQAQNDRQIEMLTTILNVNPKVINEFIRDTQQRIEKMNNVLKSPGGSQFELEGKLRALYREMHSLKGEASALRLHSFTSIASEAEDRLHFLQNQSKLSGDDFLSLTVQLDELLSLSNTISELGDRINNSAQRTTAETSSVPSALGEVQTSSELARYLVDFAGDIAERQDKRIEVDTDGMYGMVIPERLTAIVKEICIQILRNAIVHGIADAETRVNAGKSPVGKIKIAFSNNTEADTSHFMFTIEDDGKGIDYEAVRQKLIDSGKYSLDKASQLTETQLLGVLFSSGFSTKNSADEDGGRGVGLDIVKERIRQYRGKIHVYSEKGRYTRFVVKLPLNAG